MRTTLFAILLVVGGCSKAADTTNVSAMDNMATDTVAPDNTSNAMENAANASGNAMENGTSNMTVRSGPAFCPILKRTASAADCAAITEQASNMEAGIGAFEAPAAMVLNQPAAVKFAVGAADAAEETAARVGGSIANTVQVKTKLGRFMTARLSGGGFKIVADGTPERDLGASGEELWLWQVTPERKGKLELLLTVSVEAADAAGQRTRIKLATKSVPVEVSVTPADAIREKAEQSARDADLAAKVSKSWAGFFTNLALAITALGALIGAIWYFKIRKPADPAAPPAPPKDQPGGKP
jgi:hypothetical protein